MTYRNLAGLGSDKHPQVLKLAQEHDRRCQDREPGMMPSRTARILVAEVNAALITEHPWTTEQFWGVVKGIMTK